MWLLSSAFAADRALVLDYEMNPPDFSNEVIRRVAATGMTVDFRQYYPLLTQSDLRTYRMLVLEASAGGIGSGLQLNQSEVPALRHWVIEGGLLVLGIPNDPEAWPQLAVYNHLLSALGAGIEALPAISDDKPQYLGSMFPDGYLRPEGFASRGVGANLVLDRCTLLRVSAPAHVLARTSPSAFAVVGLGRAPVPTIHNDGGFPVAALAAAGKGYVFVTGRFNLNVGGFNGRVGVQPATSLGWIPSSDRFIRNILSEMARLGTKDAMASDTTGLPAAAPAGARVLHVEPGSSTEPPSVDRVKYRASVRRDLYAPYLDHGLRAAWGTVDQDDPWLAKMADGFKRSGLNYIWGVGWPDRLVSGQSTSEQRAKLRHSWETFASLLDGSNVGWSIGLNYPGASFDRKRYARSRGANGKEIEILSPLDLRLWQEVIIPALEEVARFGLRHPSVKGATVDYEMYGYEPIIFYPEAIGFEDVAYHAFLRSADGYVDAKLLDEAAFVRAEQRYPWLRDHGLLDTYFLLLENESEKLGRMIRQRIHAINPNFIFGAYQAGLPYSWFYRGLIRGLSTPQMPMLWMAFQGQSAREVDLLWGRGQHMLVAAPLMLGLHPVADWRQAMLAGRRDQDGYWLNRYNWLVDDAQGRKSIEIPDGTHDQAWASLQDGNRKLDAWEQDTAAHRFLRLPDGKRFFPIGLYGFPQDRKDDAIYREAREAGFDFLVGHEARQGFLRSYDLPGGPPDPDAAKRRGSLLDLTFQTSQKRAELTGIAQREQDTEGVIVWQGPDEPNYFPFGIRPGPSSEGLRSGAEVLRAHSTHPLWINFSPTGDSIRPRDFSSLKPYVQVPAVVSVDIYPVGDGVRLQESPFADRGLSCVGEFTRNLVRMVSDGGVQRKPVWMVLQAFGWEQLGKASSPPQKWKGRPPVYEEIRFMTFDAIINGATGVIYWGAPYLPQGDPTWTALKRVAAEVHSLEPALTGEWPAADHHVELSNRNIEAAVRRASDGKTYLLLANASPAPSGEVTVQADGKTQHLRFEPWEVKVQVTAPASSAALPTPP